MKAWILYGVNDLRFEDIRILPPEKGEALIRIRAAGICGSDIPRVFETGAHRHPLIIGHEFSGTVEGVGQEADAGWLGRRVGVFPLIPCGRCAQCRSSRYELCRDYGYLGSRRDGGFAEYVNVPVENLTELPESVSFEEAAMLEPMAVAVHAMRKGTEDLRLSRDAGIAICGFGTIGILTAMFLTEAGYRNLYVAGNKEFQKEKAASMGIGSERYCDSRDHDVAAWLMESAGGVDIFFECTGKNEVFGWGVGSVRPEGKVVLVGNPYSDMALERNTYWKILRNQLTVTGTWNSSFTGEDTDDWHYVMKRLEGGSVVPAGLITHRLPLGELWKGLSLMRNRKEASCKIMISQDD